MFDSVDDGFEMPSGRRRPARSAGEDGIDIVVGASIRPSSAAGGRH